MEKIDRVEKTGEEETPKEDLKTVCINSLVIIPTSFSSYPLFQPVYLRSDFYISTLMILIFFSYNLSFKAE